MKARQAKAAGATPAHPRQKHRSPAPRIVVEKSGYSIYSLLGASLLGAAAGYFIASRK